MSAVYATPHQRAHYETLWEERDKATQKQEEMDYNTISCEQCNARQGLCHPCSPARQPSDKSPRPPQLDADLKGLRTGRFISLLIAPNEK